jgi:hypothetical protein
MISDGGKIGGWLSAKAARYAVLGWSEAFGIWWCWQGGRCFELLRSDCFTADEPCENYCCLRIPM